MTAIVVSALFVYPVKGTRAVPLAEAEVGDRGFVDDRRFLIVDPAGKFLTQRTLPRLALIAGTIAGETLWLDAPGMAPLEVSRRPWGGPARSVEVWGDSCAAWSLGVRPAEWVSRFLGSPCELVFMPEASERPVDPALAPEGARVSFADGFPFLLTSTSSLAELARRGADVPMSRFRPNLVIDGAAPFAEDQWRAVRIGGVRFRLAKPCGRCSVTTVDQDSAVVAGLEPLRTLATFRRQDGEVMFGSNLVHEARGTVRVGDQVTVEG